ncbi:MAG: hypothetical protein U5K00_07505 [Melioribacteraceae bacterium]|nr:hypothetical protein [Melioribacteraceae bacterium]
MFLFTTISLCGNLSVDRDDTSYIFKFAMNPDSSLRGEIYVEESGTIKKSWKKGGSSVSFSDIREYHFVPRNFQTPVNFKVEQWKYELITPEELGVVDKWLLGEITINY